MRFGVDKVAEKGKEEVGGRWSRYNLREFALHSELIGSRDGTRGGWRGSNGNTDDYLRTYVICQGKYVTATG